MKTRHWLFVLCFFATIQPVVHSSDDLPYLFNYKHTVDREIKRYNDSCAYYHCLKKLLPEVKSGNIHLINRTTHCAPLAYRKRDDATVTKAVTEAKWWKIIDAYVITRITHYCNGLCKMTGFPLYYINFLLSSIPFPVTTGNFYNYFIFPLLSLCFTVSINCANLATLKIMLKSKKAGSALYYHRAEIWSDMAINILNGMGNFLLEPLYMWFLYCGPFNYYILIYSFFFEWIFLFNQFMILCLIDDRMKAMIDPFEYYKRNHKKESKKIIKRAIFKSFLISFPLSLCMSIYIRSIRFILESTSLVYFLFEVVWITIPAVTGLYSMSLVFKQIYYSFKVRKLYKKYLIVNPQTKTDETLRRKKERQKAALLWGTVALNILTVLFVWITTGVYSLWNLVNSYKDYLPSWLVNLFREQYIFIITVDKSVNILKPYLILGNGSAAFIIHLLCCQDYRKAFGKTRLGKALKACGRKIKGLFCKQNQVGVVQQA